MRWTRWLAAVVVAALMIGAPGGTAAAKSKPKTFPGGTILIPADSPNATSGRGYPGPSTVTLTAADGVRVKDVNVTLSDFSHTFPDDVDILLVGPNGASVILASDVGGGNDVAETRLSLDDEAAEHLTPSAQIVSGRFRPTNEGGGDAFSGTTASDNTLLSVFDGINPRGTWSLFVQDDVEGDVGSLSWSLTINAKVPST